MLHIVNSVAVPVSLFKSYSVYPGAIDDPMVLRPQCRRLFLTAGFLGMMYYFAPKQAGRPVYFYLLSNDWLRLCPYFPGGCVRRLSHPVGGYSVDHGGLWLRDSTGVPGCPGPEYRGFLYASVVVLVATVILWEYVAFPVFTD